MPPQTYFPVSAPVPVWTAQTAVQYLELLAAAFAAAPQCAMDDPFSLDPATCYIRVPVSVAQVIGDNLTGAANVLTSALNPPPAPAPAPAPSA